MGRIKLISSARYRKSRRAQFFTIDALIALTIIILTVIVVAPFIKQPQLDSSLSADILQSLGSLKIGEINNTYAKQLIAQGLVSDQNKFMIDQIGEFYVTNITIARLLSEEMLSSISPNENIGIWYGTELLASKNITSLEDSKNVYTERQIISGIGGGDGVTGFSSRAFLSSGTRTDYVYFGGYVGEGNISALVEYQGNITSADIELVINNDFEIYVNGVSSGSFLKSPDDFTPVSYNFSVDDFVSGENILELRGENLHIAGGFIKITYESEITYEQPERYYFPGISGIINLYDGFYVPGNLTGLKVFLHFNNSVNTFLNFGNTSVFNGMSDGTAITITNSTLASLFDYEELSRKTVPIRFGMEDMDYVTNNSRDIDVFSVTDISGSMDDDLTCSGGDSTCCEDCFWIWCFDGCDDDPERCESCGGVSAGKIISAKEANDLFIDMILNDDGNRVGLVAYAGSVLESNYHSLSDDNVSLKNEVASWDAGGGTCICCGVNRAVAGLVADSSTEKFQSLVVMSDGEATVECAQQGTGNANQDAIQSACDAYNDYGIKVYTIGFGASAGVQTLTEMASCADGSFYSAVDDLEDIYEKIAEELIETAFYEQTIEVSGDFFSQLFSDSYIEFEYEKENVPVGLITTIEKMFSSSDEGTFEIPANSTVLDANVISYSGPRWTSTLVLNNDTVYNLSSYETDFLELGDPYSVSLPLSSIEENNTLELRTGLSSANTSAGSTSNKIIYTISKGFASYTSVSATAEGCIWEIEFEDGNASMPIPSDYSGSVNCRYGGVGGGGSYCGVYSDCEGATDATQIATYNIFKLLDFDSDGKVDVGLSEDNLQIATSDMGGVPFLFSTEVQVRKWN